MKIIKYCAILIVLISFYSCTDSQTSEQEQFSFILAADWRYLLDRIFYRVHDPGVHIMENKS